MTRPPDTRRRQRSSITDESEVIYRDRRDAGRKLAVALGVLAQRSDLLVLGLPRGGVPVGYEVARALGAPLDVFVVRKLGVPGQRELAMGAIASGGGVFLNRQVIEELGISDEQLGRVIQAERREAQRREQLYRQGRPPPVVQGNTVIVVDDGLATGATMRAAVHALRQQEPAGIVVAVPVAAPSTCNEIGCEVDAIVCAATPEPFFGVSQFYQDYAQTSDDEVRSLLAAAQAWRDGAPDESPRL